MEKKYVKRHFLGNKNNPMATLLNTASSSIEAVKSASVKLIR